MVFAARLGANIHLKINYIHDTLFANLAK